MTDRNCDQSLSIIARVQTGRLVNIDHFWRCEGSLARLCAANWGRRFLTTIPLNVLPVSSRQRQAWLNEAAGEDTAQA